jgi:hypothetical protein
MAAALGASKGAESLCLMAYSLLRPKLEVSVQTGPSLQSITPKISPLRKAQSVCIMYEYILTHNTKHYSKKEDPFQPPPCKKEQWATGHFLFRLYLRP